MTANFRPRARRILVGLLLLLLLAILVVTAAILWPLHAPKAPPRPGAVLIGNINLVDLHSARIVPAQTVLLREGTIVAVGGDLGDSGRDAVKIDGTGLYLIPGLFDMHVHSVTLSPQLHHPLYIAAGVTAVRDMGGCLGESDSMIACAPLKREWNRRAASGTGVTPRYDRITSLPVNGGEEIPGGQNTALGAPDPAGARLRAAHDSERGIDFIKPYSGLSREAYLALARAARERGLYLAGHRPFAVPAAEAIEAGQRSFEHALLFGWECFPGIDRLRDVADIRQAYTPALRRQMISDHDPERCARIWQQMVERDVAFVPTHTTRKMDAYSSDPAFRSDSRLRFIPGPLQRMWSGDADNMASRDEPGGPGSFLSSYEFGLELTGRAHRAGVTVLAGTDAPDTFVFPGSALHDELEHLVQAGLTPAEALHSATLHPARFLGLEGRAGVIVPGARADLVLLESDPLRDIGAVRRIRAVVAGGTIYDRAALDRLEAGVEAVARRRDIWPKLVWRALQSPIMRAQFAD